MTKNSFDETRFRTLLGRWNDHQALRRQGADIPCLAASRWRLEDARSAARAA